MLRVLQWSQIVNEVVCVCMFFSLFFWGWTVSLMFLMTSLSEVHTRMWFHVFNTLCFLPFLNTIVHSSGLKLFSEAHTVPYGLQWGQEKQDVCVYIYTYIHLAFLGLTVNIYKAWTMNSSYIHTCIPTYLPTLIEVPMGTKAYKSYRTIFFFEKVKIHKVFCKG